MSIPSTARSGMADVFHTKSRPLNRLTVSHTMRGLLVLREVGDDPVRVPPRRDLAHHARDAGRVHVHHRDLALPGEAERAAGHAGGAR